MRQKNHLNYQLLLFWEQFALRTSELALRTSEAGFLQTFLKPFPSPAHSNQTPLGSPLQSPQSSPVSIRSVPVLFAHVLPGHPDGTDNLSSHRRAFSPQHRYYFESHSLPFKHRVCFYKTLVICILCYILT